MPVVVFSATRYPLTKLPVTKSYEYQDPYTDLFALFNTIRAMWLDLDTSFESLESSIEDFITDAPSDGTIYGRKDGGWVPAGGGGGGGKLVQALSVSTSAPQTVTNVVANLANTALANTAGTAITGLSISITPASATNTLRITLELPYIEASGAQQYIRAMIAKSDVSSMLQAKISVHGAGAGVGSNTSVAVVAGTTSAITISGRIAGHTNGTFYLGRTAALTTPWPGTFNSVLTVEEWAP